MPGTTKRCTGRQAFNVWKWQGIIWEGDGKDANGGRKDEGRKVYENGRKDLEKKKKKTEEEDKSFLEEVIKLEDEQEWLQEAISIEKSFSICCSTPPPNQQAKMPYGEEPWRGKSSLEMLGNQVPSEEKPDSMVQNTD